MVKGAKKRALEKLAFRIWQKRVKRNDPDADNSHENWKRAKLLLRKLEARYKNDK